MKVSDALSRAYLPVQKSENKKKDNVADLRSMISISKEKYGSIQELTKEELCVLYNKIVNGWPDLKSKVPVESRQYSERSSIGIRWGNLQGFPNRNTIKSSHKDVETHP